MEIINKIYFSIFIFSLIVLVDLMVKFKRPIILKFYLTLLILGGGCNALLFTLKINSSIFVLLGSLCKSFLSLGIINIFTILYFPKLKKWVNGIAVLFIIYEVLLFQFVINNQALFDSIEQKALIILLKTSIQFPLYLN
ncbi:MAG: hypothetical protein RL064_700, partial [Bacteroidota bacterium]